MNEEHISKKDRKELRKKSRIAQRLTLWAGVLVVLGLAIWGMTALVSYNNNGGSGTVVSGDVLEITERDYVKGNRDADVVLVEFSDFQCPACRGFYPLVAGVAEEFGDDIAIVYRHFPLAQIHPNATLAAQAAEAAGLQGAFWDMHDKLFDEQAIWSLQNARKARETFIGYAVDLGLDQTQFEVDLDSDVLADIIRSDYRGGLQIGVNATPTFFLNGVKMPSVSNAEQFIAIVRDAINNGEDTQ